MAASSKSTWTITGLNSNPYLLPQSRVENDKDKQLHDMVEKYSRGDIPHEQYTSTVGLQGK
jgi:hypothetical protein